MKSYIEIVVSPSSYLVSYHGEYHYCSGSTKQQLCGFALTEFLVRKTGYRWDAVPIDNVSVEDLDRESFEIFRHKSVRTGHRKMWNARMRNCSVNSDCLLTANYKELLSCCSIEIHSVSLR